MFPEKPFHGRVFVKEFETEEEEGIMKPLFFIDYDNTIFSHRTWTIPEDALQTLEGLKKDGFRVILASGRAFRTGELPEDFQGRFIPDGLVSSNGAIIEAEGKTIWEKYFDPELQRRILDFVVEKGYCLISGFEGSWCTSNLERFKSLPSNRNRKIMPEGGASFQALYHSRRPSFFLADTKEAIEDVQAHFPETRLLYMGDEMGGADIIPRENGKDLGASRILEYFQASWEDTAAIGDSMNDLNLIKRAAFGIAMGNAMPEVRAAADYVAADIDKGGLADAVSRVRRWAKEQR